MKTRALLAAHTLPTRTGRDAYRRWHAMTVNDAGQLEACCPARKTGTFAFLEAQPIAGIARSDRCDAPACARAYHETDRVLGAEKHQEPPGKQ